MKFSKGRLAFLAVCDFCKRSGITPPVAEYKFHPRRKWRFDAAWADEKVAIEFQGGIWTGGAHTRGAHFESDCLKFSSAAILGWRLLLATYDQLNSGLLLQWIEEIFPEKP